MAKRPLPPKEVEPKYEFKTQPKVVKPEVPSLSITKMEVTGCNSLFLRSEPVVNLDNILLKMKAHEVLFVTRQDGDWIYGSSEKHPGIYGYAMSRYFRKVA